jgi:hypothetical protein
MQRISSLTESNSFSKTPLHREGRLYEGDEQELYPSSPELKEDALHFQVQIIHSN